MSERSNYHGHYGEQRRESRPQGIVFWFGGKPDGARFAPYVWLSHADYEVGSSVKLDFGRYDMVLRSQHYSLANIFQAITRYECEEISEKEGELSIEIIEKEEAEA